MQLLALFQHLTDALIRSHKPDQTPLPLVSYTDFYDARVMTQEIEALKTISSAEDDKPETPATSTSA